MLILIIEQFLIILPLVLGAYLTISLLKLPDFSIENAYLFGAIAAFLAKDLPLPLVFLTSASGGAIVGLTVSFLNQYLRFPFLLAAIITNGLFHGIAQYFLKTALVSFHLSFPFPEIYVLLGIGILLIIIVFALMHSQFGLSLAVYGNNPLFFDSHHISTRYVIFGGVMIGHGLAGISGFLFAQANGLVDLSMNFGVVLLCLTALMIGKLFMYQYRPNLLIPLLGAISYFFLQQALLRIGFNLKYFNAFQAFFILLILFLGQKKQTHNLDHLGV